MLKILIEIRVPVFHDNNFFWLLFYLLFGMISFRLFYIGLIAAFCTFQRAKKICACVSVLRVRGT